MINYPSMWNPLHSVDANGVPVIEKVQYPIIYLGKIRTRRRLPSPVLSVRTSVESRNVI